jgi:hypothetical protein
MVTLGAADHAQAVSRDNPRIAGALIREGRCRDRVRTGRADESAWPSFAVPADVVAARPVEVGAVDRAFGRRTAVRLTCASMALVGVR